MKKLVMIAMLAAAPCAAYADSSQLSIRQLPEKLEPNAQALKKETLDVGEGASGDYQTQVLIDPTITPFGRANAQLNPNAIDRAPASLQQIARDAKSTSSIVDENANHKHGKECSEPVDDYLAKDPAVGGHLRKSIKPHTVADDFHIDQPLNKTTLHIQ